MTLKVVCRRWLSVANVMIMVFLSIAERRHICVRELVRDIKPSVEAINEEICKKIKIGIKEKYYLVVRGSDERFRFFTENADPDADLYLIGYNKVIPIHFEDIQGLNNTFEYFLTRSTEIFVYKEFLKHNLKCWIYTNELSSYLNRAEIDEMFKIFQRCLRFLDNVGSTEITTEDLKVRIWKRRPREIYISHGQVSIVRKTVFRDRNEFLEGLKMHFVNFMRPIPLGMPPSAFCSKYVNSIIKLLYDMGILKYIPSVEKYPELVNYLFPFRIKSGVYETRREELVVGGVVLDKILENDYLRPLFNTEEVTKRIKHGGRFIFTGHISFEDGVDKGYAVNFF